MGNNFVGKSFFVRNNRSGKEEGFRVAFPKLARPEKFDKSNENEEAKYSITMLIPKSDKDAVKFLKDQVKKAIEATDWPKTIKDNVWKTATNDDPFNDFCIFRDGDKMNEKAVATEKNVYDWRAGHIVIKFSRKESFGAPTIVDGNNEAIAPMDIENVIRPGYRIIFRANTFAYNNQKAGISMQFDAVQFVKADEEFKAESPFEALEVDEVDESDIGLDEE